MTITHAPAPTPHGMDCLCGVFCGRDIRDWRAHRDDVLILWPDALPLRQRNLSAPGERAAAQLLAAADAYAKYIRDGVEALASIQQRSRRELVRRDEAARLAYLNRPIITPDVRRPG